MPKTKYDIFPALRHQHPEKELRPIGFALQYEGEAHYVVKFKMLRGLTYYLIKNQNPDSTTDYTLFSKCFRGEGNGALRFIDPVGHGRLDMESKTRLRIYLDLFQVPVLMNLFPVV
jgi:hypothetical protein